MANVEHSALTGSNLHEPKGVSSATSGTVYVADGVGSGAWSTISQSSLASSAKAFETQLLHVRDEKALGTSGGSITLNTWTKRTLNTSKTNEISGASLASDQVILPAGTYFIEARSPAHWVVKHQTRWRNITDGSDVLYGSSETTRGDGAPQTNSYLNGRFSIAGSKTFELQHITSATRATDGMGLSGGFTTEVFAEVLIWKVA